MALINYLSPDIIAEAGTSWEELEAIAEDFKKKIAGYTQAAEAITNVLLKGSGVHSVRYRVKDPIHLIEKIVRKRHTDKTRIITIDNYEEQLTDLAGTRVLHLFKKDWRRVHKFITDTWTLHEDPIAYFREGDSEAVLDMFRQKGCDVKKHPAGYRSVHYIVETSLTKAKRFVEIQVRTIFEEGWSEIDHKLRYPNFSDNPLTNNLLLMLNRLAGSADEMSSFVQELREHLVHSQHEVNKMKREHDEQIKKLQAIIDSGNISAQEKHTLEDIAKMLHEPPGVASDIIYPFGRLPSLASLLGNKAVDLLGSKSADDLAAMFDYNLWAQAAVDTAATQQRIKDVEPLESETEQQ